MQFAHEALIREWPRLRAWLAEDREEPRLHRQLTAAARAWEESGRDDTDLYRGPRLVAAVELRASAPALAGRTPVPGGGPGGPGARAEDARRRARRLRGLLAGVAVAAGVRLIAGAVALVQRGRARHTATVAQAGRLAAQSREVAAKHPDLALLLALEAGRLDDSVDSRGALLGALEHGSRIRAWLQGFDSPVVGDRVQPRRQAPGDRDGGGTTLWDTATWRPVGPPLRSSQGGWEGVDFSPDGRTLAIAGGKGRVELWDVVDEERASGADGPGGDIRRARALRRSIQPRRRASSPQGRRRRTTSRCGPPRAAG